MANSIPETLRWVEVRLKMANFSLYRWSSVYFELGLTARNTGLLSLRKYAEPRKNHIVSTLVCLKVRNFALSD